MRSSKVKYLEISAQVIAEICKHALVGRIPADSQTLRVNYNILTNNFEVVVHSEEFPELREGDAIPRLIDPVISEDVLK